MSNNFFLRLAGLIGMLAFFFSLTAAGQLPLIYKKWLEEEVPYIITRKEREVFLSLKTDRERNLFIEAFWKQRDPLPATPRNEFREEHYRRLAYANEFFSRSTSIPGWRTDRGRIYIILGPPNNIEYFDNIMGVYPTQIWHYLGDPKDNLPTAFKIIFFRKEGTGDYIIYSPVDHGPQSLIQEYMANAKDAREVYNKLSELAPNLVHQVLSLIPGERVEIGFPSLASTRLIATVFALPQNKIKDDYAEALLRYKDVIEVDYTANYIQSEAWHTLTFDSSGYYFVHYSIEPKKITFEQDGNRFQAQFEINGRIADRQNRTIFQFEHQVPVSVNKEELRDVSVTSVAIQDFFPVIPGEYTFDLLLKNASSKEFTSYTARLIIPQLKNQDVELTPLVLGYKLERAVSGREQSPFQAGDWQILSQSRKTFSYRDSMVVCSQVVGLEKGQRDKCKLRLSLLMGDQKVLNKEISLERQNDKVVMITEVLPLENLKPGYYDAELVLLGPDGNLLASRREPFEITFVSSLPRPMIVSPLIRGRGPDNIAFLTGLQFYSQGDLKEALLRLEQAFRKSPERLDYALGYARALYASQRYSTVIEILGPRQSEEQNTAEMLALIGQSYHSLEKYLEAIRVYEDYLKRYGVNVDILNFLGTCYYQIGDRAAAVKAWTRSLELNPDQPKLKQLIESTKK